MPTAHSNQNAIGVGDVARTGYPLRPPSMMGPTSARHFVRSVRAVRRRMTGFT